MRNKHLFYIISGLLSIMVIGYFVYLVNLLTSELPSASEASLLRTSEIATFNLEKFKQLKISQ